MMVRKAAMATLVVATLCTRSACAAIDTVPEGLYTIGWEPGTVVDSNGHPIACPKGTIQYFGDHRHPSDCAMPAQQIRKRFEAGQFLDGGKYYYLWPELEVAEYVEEDHHFFQFEEYHFSGGCKLRFRLGKPYDFIPICLVTGITSAPTPAPSSAPSAMPSMSPSTHLRATPRVRAPPVTSSATGTIRSSFVSFFGMLVVTFVSISI